MYIARTLDITYTSKESINSLDPRSLDWNLEVTLYSISSVPACKAIAIVFETYFREPSNLI